jgi:hypothetical protein
VGATKGADPLGNRYLFGRAPVDLLSMKVLRHLALLALAIGFAASGYVLGGFPEVVLWLMAGSSLLLALD